MLWRSGGRSLPCENGRGPNTDQRLGLLSDRRLHLRQQAHITGFESKGLSTVINQEDCGLAFARSGRQKLSES